MGAQMRVQELIDFLDSKSSNTLKSHEIRQDALDPIEIVHFFEVN